MLTRLATGLALGAVLLFSALPAAEARGGHGGGSRFGGGSFGRAGPTGFAPKFSQGNFGGGHIRRGGSLGFTPRFGGGAEFSQRGFGGTRHGGGLRFGRHRRHNGGLRYYAYSAPLYYYGDYYYDSYYDDADSCSYLWRRYLRTGLRKWKYRYYDCID